MMRLGEFIIDVKKENQFEDAVFTRNLSNREVPGLQYLGGYVIHNLYKKQIKKNTKVMSFNNVWLYFLHAD